MIRQAGESRPSEPMKNCAITIRLEPIVQRSREPRRSESQPASGATSTITSELAMMIQPMWLGE